MRRIDYDKAIDMLTEALDRAEARCYVDSETGSNYDEGYMTLKDGIVDIINTFQDAKEYDWINE